MLLSIFVFLIAVSLVLLIGGYYIDAPVTQIAGTAIMFVTGLLLLLGTVTYVAGETSEEVYIYGDNYDGYHYDDYNGTTKIDELNVFHKNITTNTTYQSWDEELVQGVQVRHTVAVLLMITAILIFVSVLSQLREGIDDER